MRETGSYFTCKERTPGAPGLRSWARFAVLPVETYISSVAGTGGGGGGRGRLHNFS